MIKFSLLLIYFIICCISLYSQSEDERITVIGDSLVGKVVDGESIREVIGNVKIEPGKCNYNL